MKSLSYQWILLSVSCFSYLLLFAESLPVPYVSWSMDRYEGTKLIPENSNDSRFWGDFSGLGSDVFRPGVSGNATYLQDQKFKIAKNLKRDCLHDVDRCVTGLSVALWLNLERWNGDADYQIIYRTTTATRSLPGIYFGRPGGAAVSVWLRRASGGVYEVTVPANHTPLGIWTHFAMVWNKTDETLTVFVNGTALGTPANTATEPAASAALTDLVIGSSTGPTFLLDDLSVYYQPLSKDDVAEISGFPAIMPETTPTVKQIDTTQSIATTNMPLRLTSKEATSGHVPTTPRSSSIAAAQNTALPIVLGILIPVLLIVLCLALLCVWRRRRERAQEPKHQ